jgi:F-type H+-transporting ATPase subunit epsilon
MHTELITSEGMAFSGEALSVTLPSGMGEITVLKNHIPLLSTVEPGTVIIRTGDGEQLFAVARGVVQVGKTGLRILSDIADRAESLDQDAIELARKRAEELRNARRADAEEFAEATATLEREMARLMSIRRLRSRSRTSL